MVNDDLFSFRWGIALLDNGDTRIPNFFFDHYTEAGISRSEFLTILHLARYQFERPDSECRPSIGTVARQMGYTARGLQKVLAGLEKRGLLRREFRPGQTTIYDFSELSRAILVKEMGGGEPQFTPTPEPQFTPGVNPSSPKEEQQEEQANNVVGVLAEEQQTALHHLTGLGIEPGTARRLAGTCDPDQVRGWVTYAEAAQGLSNRAGFAVARLQAGEPPPNSRGSNDRDVSDWRRFMQEEYAEYVD